MVGTSTRLPVGAGTPATVLTVFMRRDHRSRRHDARLEKNRLEVLPAVSRAIQPQCLAGETKLGVAEPLPTGAFRQRSKFGK
jgi:hypothetical protein